MSSDYTTTTFRAEVHRRYLEQLWHFGEANKLRIAGELAKELKRETKEKVK